LTALTGVLKANLNIKVNSVAKEGHPGAMEYQLEILEAPV
jgi:hypothetical protein